MQLVLRDTAAKIRATFTGPDGEAADPTLPLVTITRDSDGTAIATDATATAEDDTGVASYTLAATDTDTVDLLKVTWKDGSASFEDRVSVVGGFLCSLEAIAAAIEAPPATPVLRAKREEAEEKLEHACGVAFRPSYARETLDGDGTARLLLTRPRPLSVLSATLDGKDVAAELVLAADGTVVRETAFPCGSELDLAYEHGWPVTPEPVRRAAIQLAAAYAEGAGADGINRFREDDQEVWLTVPGMGGNETALPDVNQAIAAYRYVVVG